MSDYATAEELLSQAGSKRYAETTIAGKRFLLMSITAADFAEVQALAPPADANEQKKRRALLRMQSRLIYHVYAKDRDGTRLFTLEQSEKLSELDARLSQSLFTAAAEHAGIEEADIEDLAKNSRERNTDC